MPLYAIVVQDHGNFDDVAARSTNALQAAGLSPLYLSNAMSITQREVDECDFEAWVISHGELVEVLNAEDEPYEAEEWIRLLMGLGSKTLRAIGELIDENGLARQDFDRALDAWDGFEQATQPPMGCLSCGGHRVSECGCTREGNGCGEHADGLVGIHWPTKADNTDPPEGWSWVERCDACELFEDDEAAARALIVKLGVPATGVAWFDRYSHEPVPGNQYVMGASVAIKIPEPEEGTS